MESSDLYFIIALVLLVIMSGYFSATETAFSSLNLTRVRTMHENGSKKAALVLSLAEDYDKLLSTILVGNNIVNIAMASLGAVFFVRHFGDIGATVSTAVITVVVLIFGEVSPKSLAKESPEKFAMFSAPIIRAFVVLLTPINFLFSLWKKMLSKVFKSGGSKKLTQEELLTLVSEVEQEGGIDHEESELLKSAIEFDDLEAYDILTPRVNVAAIERGSSIEEIADVFAASGFSRLPVYEGTLDSVVGVIRLKDFYNRVYRSGGDIENIMNQPAFIPGTMEINDLLKLLQKNRSHLAVVTDEFGGTVGIVTMEDILEELVGDIWDEHEQVVELFRREADGTLSVLYNANIDKLFDFLGIDIETDVSSAGGWAVEKLEKIPVVGDSFDCAGYRVTVTKADRRKALELNIKKLEDDPAENLRD